MAIVLASVDRRARWPGLIVVPVSLLVAYLKRTSPGGGKEWEEFNADRKANGNS